MLGSDDPGHGGLSGQQCQVPLPRRSQTTNNILSTASYQTYVSTFKKTVMELIISNYPNFPGVSNKVEKQTTGFLIVQKVSFSTHTSLESTPGLSLITGA